jgi:hypothetical protein
MQQPAVRYVGGLCLTRAGCGYGEARAAASTGPGVVFPTRHMAFVWSTQQKLVGSSMCQNKVRLQVSTVECACRPLHWPNLAVVCSSSSEQRVNCVVMFPRVVDLMFTTNDYPIAVDEDAL